eukprot:354411-Chlamydomonas_euryale.AAC.4
MLSPRCSSSRGSRVRSPQRDLAAAARHPSSARTRRSDGQTRWEEHAQVRRADAVGGARTHARMRPHKIACVHTKLHAPARAPRQHPAWLSMDHSAPAKQRSSS